MAKAQLYKLSTDELELRRDELRMQQEDFRTGLMKIHLAFWGLVILVARWLTHFLHGKELVAVIAILAAGIVANLAFVYRRQFAMKAKLRDVSAEISSRNSN